MNMKKWLLGGGLAVWLLAAGGCEFLRNEPEAHKLVFENRSHHAVSVIPLTIEFETFGMYPGDRVTLHHIQNPDYRFEPAEYIQEGTESDERYVIFVDAPPAAQAP